MRTTAVVLDAVLFGGLLCMRDTKVDAHWAFPKSQSGGLAVSYPFVFVGG